MRTLTVCLLLLGSTARADEVSGILIDDANVGIREATVRIVTDHAVITVRTDDAGRFRINGVPPGPRRFEVERGIVVASVPPPAGIKIDRDYIRCCGCRWRSFESVLGGDVEPPGTVDPPGRGHVDTRSTAQRIRITTPGRARRR